ncbi:MAG: hypothetical protein JKY81_08360 [Colwellia sp.]|nr:hypothetical protein [Colwellia sp.]
MVKLTVEKLAGFPFSDIKPATSTTDKSDINIKEYSNEDIKCKLNKNNHVFQQNLASSLLFANTQTKFPPTQGNYMNNNDKTFIVTFFIKFFSLGLMFLALALMIWQQLYLIGACLLFIAIYLLLLSVNYINKNNVIYNAFLATLSLVLFLSMRLTGLLIFTVLMIFFGFILIHYYLTKNLTKHLTKPRD